MSVRTRYIKYIFLIVITCILCLFTKNELDRRNFEKRLKILSSKEEQVLKIRTLNNAEDATNDQESLKIDPIRLIRVENFFIDTNKSVVYFARSRQIMLTLLFMAGTEMQKNVKLRVGLNDEVLLNKKINSQGQTFIQNRLYYAYLISFGLTHLKISSESVDKVWYRFEVDGELTPEYPVFLVKTGNPDSEDQQLVGSHLTARLIKCMHLPTDTKLFEYVLKLIIESRYDAIYLCVFTSDTRLKSLLRQFNSNATQKINLIELERFPNPTYKPDAATNNQKEYSNSFDELALQGGVDGELVDAPHEFLLNLMYPQLADKYEYVHAADHDHIVFGAWPQSRNQTFYELTSEIVKQSRALPQSSLYLNQYWALENKMSFGMLRSIRDFLLSKSVNVDNDEMAIRQNLMKLKYPVVLIPSPTFDFKLRVDNEAEMMYGLRMLKYLNKIGAREEDMFRHVVLKIGHPYIYGQMIHNTRSSQLIKLCSAGVFFPNGVSTTVAWPHSIHYRDDYNFGLVKQEKQYIPMKMFVLQVELDKL